MIIFRHKNKSKRVNIDYNSSVEEVLQILRNLFNLRSNVIGVKDQDGNQQLINKKGSFYDMHSFVSNLQSFQRGSRQLVVITDDSGLRDVGLSKSRYQESLVSDIIDMTSRPRLDHQSSLKYSTISETSSQFGLFDFIYDLEEFQSLLSGDTFTAVLLVDEHDPYLIEWLSNLEGLVQQYSGSISFYYTYSNRLSKPSTSRLAWIYRGAKKILQIVLNHPQKMQQFEELLMRAHQSKLSGRTLSQFTSPESRKNLYQQEQQIVFPQERRNKSVKRLVEQSNIRYQQQSMTQTFQPPRQSKPTTQYHKYVTHIQARVSPHQDNGQYSTDNDPERLDNRPQTWAARSTDRDHLHMQDKLIELITDLEYQNILDMQFARMVKRLILEENKQITMVLNGYLNKIYDERVLCQKLARVINNQDQEYPRPSTPSNNQQHTMQQHSHDNNNTTPAQQSNQQSTIQQQQPQSNKQSTPRSQQKQGSDVNIETLKKELFESNMQQLAPEEYGLGIYLLQTSPDPVLINLAKDVHQRMIKNGGKPNLVGLLTYIRGKFNENLQRIFSFQEQQIINEHKSKRTSSVYAIFQCFRYEANFEEFLESLRKAITSLNIISSNSSLSITHQQKGQHQSVYPPQINDPKLVLTVSPMPSQPKSEKERVPIPPLSRLNPEFIGENSPKQEISLFSKDHTITAPAPQVAPVSKPKPKTPRKKDKTANEEIFSEEEFMRIKLLKRKENSSRIEAFFNTQKEAELQEIFDDMITSVRFEDPVQSEKIHRLFKKHDSKLYDILKNFSSFKSVPQTYHDLRKLIQDETDDPHYIQDYRKQKAFNLFKNQVRQFCIQKHIADQNKNILLKLFLEEDIQVLGSLETYLINGDAQDMLDTLKTIVQQYSKYINVQQYSNYTPVDSRRHSFDKKDANSEQRLSESGALQVPFIVSESRTIIARFRQYFNADQKLKLERLANSENDTIYKLFQQYRADSDLNGFIQKLISLTIDQPYTGRQHYQKDVSEIELAVDKFVKEGLLKIDEFIVDKIAERSTDPLIQGILEYYNKTQDKVDFCENIKFLGRALQKQKILETIELMQKEAGWSNQKKQRLIKATLEEHSILLGAFAVYFRCPPADEEMEKSELIDTMNRLFN